MKAEIFAKSRLILNEKLFPHFMPIVNFWVSEDASEGCRLGWRFDWDTRGWK